MKLQLMSDLHFEYHKDKGDKFISSLDPTDVDLLVLAGDVSEINHINFAIEKLCEKYPEVVMVAGNHSFYTSNREDILDNFASLEEQFPNFHFLENEVFEYKGKRIVGTTLWYPTVNPWLSMQWSDFHYIKDLNSWVYDENKKAQTFLYNTVKEGDIVLTHMLPSHKCVHPLYQGQDTNVFFVCPMDELIMEAKPSHWFHGHTHKHIDLMIGETRVVANPRGYTEFSETEEKNGFIKKMIIEV